MATATEIVVELVQSALRLPVEIANIAFQGPVSFVSVLVGSAFLFAASGLLGYLVVGALAELVGVEMPTLGRGPRDAPARIPTERPNPNFEEEGASGAGRAKRDE